MASSIEIELKELKELTNEMVKQHEESKEAIARIELKLVITRIFYEAITHKKMDYYHTQLLNHIRSQN